MLPSTALPTTALGGRSRPNGRLQSCTLNVRAAGKKGGGKQKGGVRRVGGGGGKQRGGDGSLKTSRSPELAMSDFRGDEVLMFNPVKPSGNDPLTVVYAYPNDYTVGITSLGYQLVWSFFEQQPYIDVRRMFMDARDALPMRADLLGFSFSWELDYKNVLTTLEQMGVPIFAEDRGPEHPLVFGGGPVLTANPEPYAEFFDVVLLGDGEGILSNFSQAVYAARGGSGTRQELLISLSQLPGIYCPSLYHVEYSTPDGPISKIEPVDSSVPRTVKKQTHMGGELAMSTVVSSRMAWESIYMVEVVRSCPEMCRFCLASYLSLPFRTANLQDSLIPSISKGLEVTKRIGLLGASVSQHPEFPELLEHLTGPGFEDVRLSIASVRANTVTKQLASALAGRGTKSLTIAVESGSPRVRDIVNKKLAQHEIVEAASNAQEGGLEKLKLYGMVGVPGEEDADVDATVDMMLKLKKEAPRLGLTLGCSTFVPKAHTPFQWYGVDKAGEKRLTMLSKAFGKAGIDFRPESFKWSVVQALLSRGDRRITPLLLRVREYGDSAGSFRRAFKEMDGLLPPMEYYVHHTLCPGEAILPWAHLEGALPEGTLVKHAETAAKLMTPATVTTF